MNNSSFYLLDNRGSLLHHHDYHVEQPSSHGKFTLPSCMPIASHEELIIEHQKRKLLLQQNIIPLGSALTSPSLLVNGSGLGNNKIVESKFAFSPLSVVEAHGLFRKDVRRSGSFTNTFAEPSKVLFPKQKVGTGVYFNNTEIIAGELHLPGSAMPHTSTASTSSSINLSPFGGPLMAPPALHCIHNNANEQTPTTALQHVTFQNDSTISLKQIAESLVLHTTSSTKQGQEHQEKEKKDGQNKEENDRDQTSSLIIPSEKTTTTTTTTTRYSKKKMIMMKHEQDLLKDSHSNAKRRKLSQDEETFLQAAAKLSSLS